MICASCESDILAYPCPCGYGQSTQQAPRLVRDTYYPLPNGSTKEAFGLNLYEVIKLIGGLMGIDTQRAVAIHKQRGYVLQELNARRLALQKSLAVLLPLLTDEEMRKLLDRYPQVTGY